MSAQFEKGEEENARRPRSDRGRLKQILHQFFVVVSGDQIFRGQGARRQP
ncbi:MAG: hypothetical protein ACI83Y_002403 [Candidatus Azotimanducaceae bacterium]